jgi:hypothetical protein
VQFAGPPALPGFPLWRALPAGLVGTPHRGALLAIGGTPWGTNSEQQNISQVRLACRLPPAWTRFPNSLLTPWGAVQIPCSFEKFPCSVSQGISLQASECVAVSAFKFRPGGAI